MGCSSSSFLPTATSLPEPQKPTKDKPYAPQPVAPPPEYASVLIPAGARPGTILRFQVPDGRIVEITVPADAQEGKPIKVQLPRRQSNHKFSTLLEAFHACDPSKSGSIQDHALFGATAKLLVNEQADTEAMWSDLDQDKNGVVNFPEFVEWAERHDVRLPIGLHTDADRDHDSITLPSGWEGPRDDRSWNARLTIENATQFQELQSLLNLSYKKIWTRDRKATGNNKVPSGYKLLKAVRSENYSDWRRYYLRRHMLAHICSTKSFVQHRTLTHQATLCRREKLRPYVNEWLLFHGTNAESAENICSGDFTMALAGSATGTLYGRGTYFAESITKADEYAKEGPDGSCCVLVCRVVGGCVLYNDEVTPDAQRLQDGVLHGQYHSVLGDREKCRNTFKEYVVFDADQIYVDYALFYKRLYE